MLYYVSGISAVIKLKKKIPLFLLIRMNNRLYF